MKLPTFALWLTGLSSVCCIPAHAIEVPADTTPPPPEVRALPNKPAPDLATPETTDSARLLPPHSQQAHGSLPPLQKLPPGPMSSAPSQPREGSAFLGVTTTEVPAALRAQLALPMHEGVLVRSVMPGSPAAAAGLTEFDVILKIADMPVHSQAHFSEFLGSKLAGDVVEFSLVRVGRQSRVSVTLGSRPLAEPSAADSAHGQAPYHSPQPMELDDMPQGQADRIRELIERNLQLQQRTPRPGTLRDGLDVTGALQEMHRRMTEAFNGPGEEDLLPGGNDSHFSSDTTMRMQDQEGSVEIHERKGNKQATIRDKAGTVTWSGPWNTEENKASAGEFRSRIEKLQTNGLTKSRSFRFSFGSGNGNPNSGVR